MRKGVSLPRRVAVFTLGLGGLLASSSACRVQTAGEPLAATPAADEAEPASADSPTTDAAEPAAALAPAFTLSAHDDRTVSLDDLTRDGPAILVFYRGHW